MKALPKPKLDALKLYLSMDLCRPGRSRLFATGYEQYGVTLEQLGSFTSPLIFEDSSGEDEFYGVAGTSFLVRYRGQLFALTAQHCLSPQNGNDVRLALSSKSKTFLPLKQLHRMQSIPPNQDYADIAIFEAAPELLEAEEQQSIRALQLDPLRNHSMDIKSEAKLVVPGYPKCLNGVDYDSLTIQTQCYLPSGNYMGRAGRPGVHSMRFDELEQIDWPDGMSGSPVFFVEEHPEAHFFGLHGMLIKAAEVGFNAEFVGADVMFRYLDAIIDAGMEGKTD